ncbi:MAG TPA: hypothetical protein VMM76_24165, partial [Pirellulaceae bacterium]|nr:hypothetical protein [Pirellulaceae bacterium]
QLADGDWIMVVHRAGCSKCSEVREEYLSKVSQVSTSFASRRLAFIELPPFRNESFNECAICVEGRLSGSLNWVGRTPVVVYLTDGFVRAVIEG